MGPIRSVHQLDERARLGLLPRWLPYFNLRSVWIQNGGELTSFISLLFEDGNAPGFQSSDERIEVIHSEIDHELTMRRCDLLAVVGHSVPKRHRRMIWRVIAQDGPPPIPPF